MERRQAPLLHPIPNQFDTRPMGSPARTSCPGSTSSAEREQTLGIECASCGDPRRCRIEYVALELLLGGLVAGVCGDSSGDSSGESFVFRSSEPIFAALDQIPCPLAGGGTATVEPRAATHREQNESGPQPQWRGQSHRSRTS
jgi:hypothetical protein